MARVQHAARIVCLLGSTLLSMAAENTGDALYRVHCSPCHGAAGEGGKGPKLAELRLQRAVDDKALSAIITAGIPGTAMPGTRMTTGENERLTEYVRSLGRKQPAAVAGNPAAGEKLFRGRGNCGTCHAVSGRGGISGPDLTAIGLKRGPAHLRESLVNPSAEIPDNFAVYRRVIAIPDNYLYVEMETRDGQRISGVRLNEDTFSIQVRDASGRLQSFRKSELTRLEKLRGKSQMPSYRDVFTPAELDDLVAWLSSLRGDQ